MIPKCLLFASIKIVLVLCVLIQVDEFNNVASETNSGGSSGRGLESGKLTESGIYIN